MRSCSSFPRPSVMLAILALMLMSVIGSATAAAAASGSIRSNDAAAAAQPWRDARNDPHPAIAVAKRMQLEQQSAVPSSSLSHESAAHESVQSSTTSGAPDGSPCTYTSDCQNFCHYRRGICCVSSTYCVDVPVGANCTSSVDCGQYAYCVNKRCTDQRARGTTCTTDDEYQCVGSKVISSEYGYESYCDGYVPGQLVSGVSVCRATRENGAVCTNSHQCASTYCKRDTDASTGATNTYGKCEQNLIGALGEAVSNVFRTILIAIGVCVAVCVIGCIACCWRRHQRTIVVSGAATVPQQPTYAPSQWGPVGAGGAGGIGGVPASYAVHQATAVQMMPVPMVAGQQQFYPASAAAAPPVGPPAVRYIPPAAATRPGGYAQL